MTKRILVALAALVLGSFALAACGGDDEPSATTEPETAGSTEASGGGATIDVSADPGGSLAFTETELTTEAGSNTINLENESSTPHNVYVEDADGNVLAETETITGSSTSTSADLEAGTYTFFCDVPGHREAGMEGALEVE